MKYVIRIFRAIELFLNRIENNMINGSCRNCSRLDGQIKRLSSLERLGWIAYAKERDENEKLKKEERWYGLKFDC